MKQNASRRIFLASNALILFLATLVCLAPVMHLLSLSLSKNIYALAGQVGLWPKGFTLNAYSFLIVKSQFVAALFVSVERVILGTLINMTLVVLTAYPLSKEVSVFRARTAYAWFFAITMFFGGGLIPTYIVVKTTGIMNTIWSLVLPGALNVWYCVLLLNFFRGIPKELEEAARIDGASHIRTLIRIYLPLSMPALATIVLFTIVSHWNNWFDAFIYLNSPKQYPLQTYLYTLVRQSEIVNKKSITPGDLARLRDISDKTLKIAQIFLGALPVMLVYPFLQKYFVKGIVVGSVKG